MHAYEVYASEMNACKVYILGVHLCVNRPHCSESSRVDVEIEYGTKSCLDSLGISGGEVDGTAVMEGG